MSDMRPPSLFLLHVQAVQWETELEEQWNISNICFDPKDFLIC